MHSFRPKRLAAYLLAQVLLVAGVVYAIWDFTAPLRAREEPRPARAEASKPPLEHTVRGKVQTPDGQPVADAEVCFAGEGYYRTLHWRHAQSNKDIVHTDAEGRFSLPACKGPITIFAEHDQGFVSAVLETDAFDGVSLTLSPWAEVQATIRHGDQPVAGVEVEIDITEPDNATQHLRFQARGTTKPDGMVTIRKLIAGFGTLNLRKIGGDDSGLRIEGGVETRSGERQMLTVGGRHNAVAGLVTNARGFLPAPVDDVNGALRRISNHTKAPDGLGEEELKAWYKAWRETPESRREYADNNAYFFNLQPDGRFQLTDLRPGSYMLSLQRYGPPEPGTGFLYPVEIYKALVEIPDPGDEGAPAKHDLGVLRLAHVVDKPGKDAVDFAFTTIDSKAQRLRDLRGKYVLLDFWGVFCPPCRDGLPKLRALHKKYSPSGKFVLIGLSADAELKTLTDFVTKESLPWLQVHLRSQNLDAIEEVYGARGYPTGVLIDPDGKIVASGLRTDDMVAAVEKALGQP